MKRFFREEKFFCKVKRRFGLGKTPFCSHKTAFCYVQKKTINSFSCPIYVQSSVYATNFMFADNKYVIYSILNNRVG